MSRLFQLRTYLEYRLKAVDEHGIHPPFLFDLYDAVVSSGRRFYAFDIVEKERRALLENKSTIKVTDFGAGSSFLKGQDRSISDIAKYSLKEARTSQMLFRLAHYFKTENILELGTSLGITSLYLSKWSSAAKVQTIEGCPEIAKVAQSVFKKHKAVNIESHIGEFSQVLKNILTPAKKFDLIYVDGNHRKTPTLEYFQLLKNYIHQNSVIVFDDIHWSREMQEAWSEIIKDKDVTLSLDLYTVGIVFFRKELSKQDFTLAFF